MDRSDIIKQVQVRLDELSPFEDTEEVPSITYIDKLLDASTDAVFFILPTKKLPATDKSVMKLTKGKMKGEFYLVAPTGYIRLALVDFADWKRPVTEVADSFVEKLQGSVYTMGKPTRPVVTERKFGNTVSLHFFTLPSVDSVMNLQLIMSMKPEDCPELLIDAIAWQCAADVLASLGKNNTVAKEKVLTYEL